MSSTQRYLLIASGIILVFAAVTVILVLRQRSLESRGTENGISAVTTSTNARRQTTDTFTPAEQQRRAEVLRLQQTLPKDLRELWTPEFRREQDELNLKR